MSEPTTEAGRTLLRRPHRAWPKGHDEWAETIEIIEDAARSDLLAELRARVEALPRQMQHADPFFPDTYDYETVGLDVLLALLWGPGETQ